MIRHLDSAIDALQGSLALICTVQPHSTEYYPLLTTYYLLLTKSHENLVSYSHQATPTPIRTSIFTFYCLHVALLSYGRSLASADSGPAWLGKALELPSLSLPLRFSSIPR